MTYTTYHAENRAKERCGLNKKTTERMAKIAYEKGLKHSDCSGRLRKYITSLYFYNQSANQIRVYGDKVYIFYNEILITIMNLPNNLKNIVNKKGYK
jgi:hypothetical protein